jgi:hypothetical protein
LQAKDKKKAATTSKKLMEVAEEDLWYENKY